MNPKRKYSNIHFKNVDGMTSLLQKVMQGKGETGKQPSKMKT